MTFKEAKKIAFREPILFGNYWIVDIYPKFINGRHILRFKNGQG